MAPAGYRLRMMEPGDGPALLAIERRATDLLVATGIHPARPATELSDFSRFLVSHDVIVAAAAEGGRPVGYAAGLDMEELYWLAELGVDPAHGRRGLGRALVRAVCERAGWFFHRAVGLTTYRDVPFNAPFYRDCGFMTVSRQDLSPRLEERFLAELPAGVGENLRTVMVKWL